MAFHLVVVLLLSAAPAKSTPPKAGAPYAYLIPGSEHRLVEALHEHKAELQSLREDIELDVLTLRVEAAPRDDQGDEAETGAAALSLATEGKTVSRRFPAGTVLLCARGKQNLAAAKLLDPAEAPLSKPLKPGDEFPVVRLMAPVPILLAPLPKPAKKPLPKKPILLRKRPNLSGSPTHVVAWLKDGRHFLQFKQGQLCKVEASSGRSEPFYDIKKVAAALQRLPTIDPANARKLAKSAAGAMNPARDAALLAFENDLYFVTLAGDKALRLTSDPSREELAEFSPDGRFVAFVRDFDLHVVDVATGASRALTTGGSTLVRHGKADWVYYEEVLNRSWRAFDWSPDSRRLAFLRFDDTPVGEFAVVDQIPRRQRVEQTRYPKPGDPNPRVTLGVVTAAGGSPRWIALDDYSADATLIVRFGWSGEGKRLYFYVQDRAQTWLDFMTASNTGREVKRLFRERTKAWVENPGAPHFMKDGGFLLASQRDGWRRVYRFDAEGQNPRPLTTGPWETHDVQRVDEAAGWVYLTGGKDSPLGANLYRVRLDGSCVTRLTDGAGGHHTQVSPAAELFVDTASDHRTPTRLTLREMTGASVRMLDTNPVMALDEYELGQVEFVQIKARDGFVLEGALLKPMDFDPKRRYPVWFMTYGGPHAPTVRDAWSGGRTYDQALARMGLVVFRCDPRSASGKGACSAWTAYRQLGVAELRDIEDAIGWVGKLPYVDTKRVGMSGTSYGGFLTAYAMTHSKLFAAGVAGAPVTEWRNYDSIYTERYMNLPQENPEGYAKTSVVAAAKNLHGRLLLIHGGIDDNVHIQNTWRLADALQRANKPFDLMVYPRNRHGFRGAHYDGLVEDFIRKTLRP